MPIPIADFRLDLFDPILFSSTTFRGWKPPLGEFIQNKHTLFFSFLTEEIGQKVIPGKWVVQRLSTNNLLVTDNLNQCWKDWVLKLRQQECVCVCVYIYICRNTHTEALSKKVKRDRLVCLEIWSEVSWHLTWWIFLHITSSKSWGRLSTPHSCP